jgi:hypothetical protein
LNGTLSGASRIVTRAAGRIALAAKPWHAEAFGQAQIQLRVAEITAVHDDRFHRADVAALRIKLHMLDKAVRPAFAYVQFGAGLAVLVAMKQALCGKIEGA